MTPRRPIFLHEQTDTKSTPDLMAPLYAGVFGEEGGQRVFEDIARMADTPPINHNDIDPNQAVWILARQNLVKQIRNLIERGNRNGQ